MIITAPLPFDSPAVACSAFLPTRCLSSDDDTIGAPVSSALLCSPVSDPHCCTAVPANRRDPSNTAGEDLGGHYLETEEINNMVHTAYGASLYPPSSLPDDSEWVSRWRTVTQLSNKHYDLPRGSCGRRYVDLLNTEIRLLSRGVFPSERVLVFSTTILQCDRMIRKGQDIVRTLNRRMDLWDRNHYDSLIQEAVRCDHPFQTRRWPKNRDEHTKRIFSRLMLQGKIRAAIRWLTEHLKG